MLAKNARAPQTEATEFIRDDCRRSARNVLICTQALQINTRTGDRINGRSVFGVIFCFAVGWHVEKFDFSVSSAETMTATNSWSHAEASTDAMTTMYIAISY